MSSPLAVSSSSLASSTSSLSSSEGLASSSSSIGSSSVYSMKISEPIADELQKKHPEMCYLFRVFLKNYLDGEYWQMWMEVDKFREADYEQRDKSLVRIKATQIFDKYWAPTSEFHIDIRPKVKEALAHRIDSGDVDITVFNEALSELEAESYRKFLRSDTYAGFMADKGVFVRTSSPKRRVSITELFKKKSRRGSNLKFSAEIDSDTSTFSLEGGLGASLDMDAIDEGLEEMTDAA